NRPARRIAGCEPAKELSSVVGCEPNILALGRVGDPSIRVAGRNRVDQPVFDKRHAEQHQEIGNEDWLREPPDESTAVWPLWRRLATLDCRVACGRTIVNGAAFRRWHAGGSRHP